MCRIHSLAVTDDCSLLNAEIITGYDTL